MKIKLSDAFNLIEFPDKKFVLTYKTTRKVHSDFGKEEAKIINAFIEANLVQIVLEESDYKDDVDEFLEFIDMLLNEKVLIIDD